MTIQQTSLLSHSFKRQLQNYRMVVRCLKTRAEAAFLHIFLMFRKGMVVSKL